MQTRFDAAQLRDPDTAEAEKVLRKCVHCGFCTATCPTYVLLGDELDSPRGRIYLIKDMLEQHRPATATVVRHLDRCLSCLGCMTTCPSGVHYQHLIDHARDHVERTYRRPLAQRLLRAALAAVLPHPTRLHVALWLAGRVPAPLRRSAALPAPLRAMLELAATHAGARRQARVPSRTPAPVTRRGRVALIMGCAQGVLTPQTHEATQRLLSRAGWEVLPVSGCCGALVHHLGRRDEADGFARRLIGNLRAAETAGAFAAVVVNASGCGTQLKDYGYLLRGDPHLAQDAARFSALARDVTEVLALHALPLPLPSEPLREQPVIAYHSACSMQHGQQLDALPRQLLRAAGFEVREIPEGHLCCGSAGSYNILQPQIATQLRERKLANIASTGAGIVATGNVGCITQLRAGGAPPVVHTVELLDWACGGPRPTALAPQATR